jgi:diaminohydroxyphosphoribosylaminopyrimidine deaminase/5-amino-6-(5-phosphoribosylamino)uracil reductase
VRRSVLTPTSGAAPGEEQVVASDAERKAMLRACALAAQGLGATSPNPVVGAVVLDRSGHVVGEGWHEQAGGPHAEVHALDAAGDRAAGGTLVVTLEPCAHVGRTPPCTDAVLRAGVARVVVGVADPVAGHGGGSDRLRTAGVDVETGTEADACERVNEAWLLHARTGRPYVTLKVAVTVDGRVAATDGSSRWITSEEARADAHRLRAQCDAVLVGVGTVLADDPHLTVRGPDGSLARRQPWRVVLDSHDRVPRDAKVRDDAAPQLVLQGSDGGRLSPADALRSCAEIPVQHVLVEGGPRVAASFLDAGLVDRVVAYVAPALMGSGPSALEGGAGSPTIARLRRFRLDDVTQVGGDVRLTMRSTEGAACSPA